MTERRRELSRLGAAILSLAVPGAPLAVFASGTPPADLAGQAENPVGAIPPFGPPPPGQDTSPGWRHQTLPKVARSNSYRVVVEDGQPVLQVRSRAAASSWVAAVDIDAQRQPHLHWRWRVSRALPGSDLSHKPGDDYAARLYVFFALDPATLSLGDRLRLSAARLLAGTELPAAALCYVWGQVQPVGTSGWNPYTDRVRMIVVDSGDTLAGGWRSHSRDLRRDWAGSFGGPLPRVNGVAVGADTDNTGAEVEAAFAGLRFDALP